MKHKVIRYGMIVLLIGLVALAAGRTYAQIGFDLDVGIGPEGGGASTQSAAIL